MSAAAPLKIVVLTVIALVAFAGNSILCRMALRSDAIDPVSFTALRLASGALALLPFLRRGPRPWSPRAATALGTYALAFSLAYVSLDAGTGALLLFGSVQIVMIGWGLLSGERPNALQILGIGAAATGLVLLVLPGVSAPDFRGALLMMAAGVAWGVYSLLGRRQGIPTASTACNFVATAPVAVIVFALHVPWMTLTPTGALLALASGALTSGLGYVIWYATLPHHSATSAAVVQLAVPALAATGGVAFLGEAFGMRLLLCGGLTLAGVAVALLARRPNPAPHKSS